jgi:hypothetical protein
MGNRQWIRNILEGNRERAMDKSFLPLLSIPHRLLPVSTNFPLPVDGSQPTANRQHLF